MKKQSIAIIGVIAFVLAVAVGYALFSDALNITGTAKAQGSFDYDFSVGEITSTGVTKNGVTTELSNDNDTLTITVDHLEYPGATVRIPVTVTNTGSITGKLETIDQSGLPSDSVVTVEYTGPASSDTPLVAGESHDMAIVITWPKTYADDLEDSTTSETEFTETVSFSVNLDYIQATGTATDGE